MGNTIHLKSFFSFTLLIVCLGMIFSCSATRHPHNAILQTTDPLYEEIETLGNELTVKNNVPGVAVAVIRDGKVAWIQSISYADLASKKPVASETRVVASIASSTYDMLKYMAFQLNEKDPVVSLSHQPTFGKIEDGAIALNWKVKTAEDGRRSISHTGGSLGFSSYMVFYPDLNSGIVLLSNEAGQGTQNELISLADKIMIPITHGSTGR